ncbi:hypothetical protein [Methanoregula sp.]|jgi:hypothetical protein|uniref:hypothetical protein n=1 Tax=Methanoregula sp. TaxID=2052170 RepID=UPI003C71CF2D
MLDILRNPFNLNQLWDIGLDATIAIFVLFAMGREYKIIMETMIELVKKNT